MCPLCCEWPRKSLLTVVHTQFQRPSLVLACKSIFFCFYNYNYNERPFVQQSTLEERKLPLLTSHRKSNMFWSTITFTLTNIFGPFETFSTVKTCNSTPTTVPGAISTEKGSMSTFDTIYCVLFLPLLIFVYEDQTPDWLYFFSHRYFLSRAQTQLRISSAPFFPPLRSLMCVDTIVVRRSFFFLTVASSFFISNTCTFRQNICFHCLFPNLQCLKRWILCWL